MRIRLLIFLCCLFQTLSYSQTITADFSATPTLGTSVPHIVKFTDESINPDLWLWDFGDGGTSKSKNPTHSYDSTGEFEVKLKVEDTIYGISDTATNIVRVSIPVANFSNDLSSGCAPLTIKFMDTSTGNGAPIIAWNWDFGDGETSTEQNPVHIYQNAGIHTIALTITDSFGNTNSISRQAVDTSDALDPTVITKDITVTLDASGNANITVDAIDNGSSDNCGIGSRGIDITSFDCTAVGVNTVTLTVIDENGNSATNMAIVTVEDVEEPTVITQDITIALDASGQANITPDMIDNGSFDACGIGDRSLDTTFFDCPILGTTTVTLTVTDNNGNYTSGTASITFTGEDDDLDGIVNACDTAFNVSILPKKGISPNGDGDNDSWEIGNITDFPQAQIAVFDKNGKEVFRTSNYQNDWRGTKSANGDLLPVGSYFYTINLLQPGVPQVTGWLYINY